MELVIGDATHGDGRGMIYGSFAMHFLIQKYCHDRAHYFTWDIIAHCRALDVRQSIVGIE